ncbi:unnamed protein product [Cylindrotheca closterium]|uniref:Uncharacterized protein n=1 Tax=Cylindrotheca closterium TaxID=2856 RepID=A0AAD2FMY7_9STRA|nr:unnamed protein product [Cylindrotheca closterium]
MCTATGISRSKMVKRPIHNTLKVCATNEKSKPTTGAASATNFAERCTTNLETRSSSRFDAVTFVGRNTMAPTLPCKERHYTARSMDRHYMVQSLDRLLREETASPEPLNKPRRWCSLCTGSPFDQMFAESAPSEPLTMPRRSM